MFKMQKVERGIVSLVRADANTSVEIKAIVNELNKAFHDFKAEHSKQLDEHKKGTADALQAVKVEAINAKISELQKSVDEANIKMAGIELGGGKDVNNQEQNKDFLAFMRSNQISAALTKGSNPDGGYLAPVEWDRTITDKLIISSPMRSICGIQTISGAGFTKVFNQRGTASGWVGESEARPETNTPQFAVMTYATGELYAKPKTTQQLLDDAEVNLEQWLAGEVDTEFAFQEGSAFLNGTGANGRPTGVLTYVTGGANAAAHPFGAITTVNSGAAAAITSDGIVDLVHSLSTERAVGARFIMNLSTIQAIRKLKDGQGNYLWQPSMQAGQPSTLAGYGVTEMAGMPNIGAAAKPVLFGNFQMGYLIIDRKGTSVLRDPYTDKPFVQFYTTKRVGGGLANPEYLRALNIAV